MNPRKMKHKDGEKKYFKLFALFLGTLYCFWSLHSWNHTNTSTALASSTWQGSHLNPTEILNMKDTVSSLIFINGVTTIPSEIGLFAKLTNLNIANNQLHTLPSEVGILSSLEMLGLKNNNLRQLPSEIGMLSNLKAVFLTGNNLEDLPSQIGTLESLRKFQAASNFIKSLPDQIGNLKNLELLRFPNNDLSLFQASLSGCDTLAWPAFSGNPFVDKSRPLLQMKKLNSIDITYSSQNLASVEYGGAANDGVYTGHLKLGTDEVPIAVKFFQQGVTPDGDPWEELRVGTAIQEARRYHSKDHALVTQYGYIDEPRLAAVFGLVLDSEPLAMKPLDSVRMLRGRFTHQSVKYLHSMNIAHGDVYAHNILIHKEKKTLQLATSSFRYALLFDFGASFFYPNDLNINVFEAVEVRAFGLLVHDLLTYMSIREHYHNESDWLDLMIFLQDMASACTKNAMLERPSFIKLQISMKELKSYGPIAARQVLQGMIRG